MLKVLTAVVTLFIAAAFIPSLAVAQGEQPNLLVVGEDADTDTIPRHSRIFDRVLRAIEGELQAYGFAVYDETLLSLDITDPERVRRTDAEWYTIASRIQTPPIDAVVSFEIFASTQKANFADITDLRLRIPGRILHVPTHRALANFEVAYNVGDLPPLPPNCDRECVLEHVGDQARQVAADVGAVLAARLDQITPPAPAQENQTSQSENRNDVSQDECSGLSSAFTMQFRGFSPQELTAIEEYLVVFRGYEHHRPMRSGAAQTDYWYETCSDTARLSNNLRLMSQHLGLTTRIALTGNRIEIDNIGEHQNR